MRSRWTYWALSSYVSCCSVLCCAACVVNSRSHASAPSVKYRAVGYRVRRGNSSGSCMKKEQRGITHNSQSPTSFKKTPFKEEQEKTDLLNLAFYWVTGAILQCTFIPARALIGPPHDVYRCHVKVGSLGYGLQCVGECECTEHVYK